MKAMTRASFLDGRGTALSAAKCCQSACGSKADIDIKGILDIVGN